jgi:long-chain acyl-CoA synthetase
MVGALLATAAARWGERVFVVDDDGRSWTFDEMYRWARGGATALRARGVGPGDRVALMARSSAEFVAAWFGCALAGATVVPIPTVSAPPEVAHRLAHARCRLAIFDDELAALAHAAAVERLAPGAWPSDPLVPTAAGTAKAEPTAFDSGAAISAGDAGPAGDGAAIAAANARPAGDDGASIAAANAGPAFDDGVAISPGSRGPAGDGDAVAMILYTSGTTGVAKAAAFSHASLAIHARNVAATVGLDDGDVILGALPLTHSFGCRMVLLLATVSGARIELLGRFDGPRALARIAAAGVTFWPVVPTMLAAVCAVDGPPLPSLRWLLSAGAPLPDALCRRAEARLGCVVRQGYGLTEASFSTIDAPPSLRVIGSVGLPVAGVELRLGGGGEVEVRGPHVMLGYVDDPAATAVALDGGWLRTGDVGQLDGDGRLTIVDRAKDLIIRGGNNVYPSEVEAALAAHPAVAEVAVVGRPDDYHGEEVVAVVVIRAGATADADELAAFARERVAATKVPREYAFVAALPLGPSAKVLKRELRRRLAAGELPTTKPTSRG